MKPFYIDAAVKRDLIHCWTRDRNGELSCDTYPVSDYSYCFQPLNTDAVPLYQDIYGNPLKKISFDNPKQLKDFAKKRDNLFESDLSVVSKFFLDQYSDGDYGSPVNAMFYDIETDFDLSTGSGYPSPKDPHGEINAFSMFDNAKKRYIMLINEMFKDIVTLKDKDYPVDIIWCKDERDMLITFAECIEDVDVLAGWFTAGFDLPYIFERAFIHFDEEIVLTMFCRDGFKAHRRDFVNKFKEEVWSWNLVGRQHVDMKDLYSKFVPGEGSKKLDVVVEKELKMNKIDYEDDLGTLYRENPQKFFEYSLHDSRLLKCLDDKLQIIDQAIMIARSSCVKMSAVSGSVTAIEGELMKFCRAKGNYILPDRKNNKRSRFKGAIVYDTISGLHGIGFTVDLGSLYPSTMGVLGCSPETLIMQCKNGMDDFIAVMEERDDDIEITLQSEEKLSLPAKDLYAVIRECGYTISGNGTVFNGKMGILAEFACEGLVLRKKYQKEMKDAEGRGDVDGVKVFNLRQKVTKTRNNSIYGVTGEPSFRLYDLRISQSITLSAQFISKHQAVLGNNMVDEVLAA